MSIKRICVVGRARAGKSRMISRFLKEPLLVRNLLESSGSDCTKINTIFTLTKDPNTRAYMRYLAPGSRLNGIEIAFEMDYEDKIRKFMTRIQKENTYSQTEGEKLAGDTRELNIMTDYIEIVAPASSLAIEIMGNDIQTLIITDTPGVSGSIPLTIANDADLYILMMRDDNDEEFQSSIEKIIPKMAGSRVLFIYRNANNYTTKGGYNEVHKQVKKAVDDFADDLSRLVGDSVLNTSLEVLNPSGKVIPMGAFDITEINYAEKCFDRDLKNKLIGTFSKKKGANEEQVIIDSLAQATNPDLGYTREDVITFFDTIVDSFTMPQKGPNFKVGFAQEGHDRVKTNDRYRIEDAVNENASKILDELYNLYKVMTYDPASPVAKMTQEAIIKLVYIRLTEAIKFNCGIFAGGHQWEDSECKTMFAIEAIYADELLARAKTDKLTIADYQDVIIDGGITSKSWDYVYKKPVYKGEYEYCNHKLDIIRDNKLNDLASSNTKELIYNAYTLGLLNLGKYRLRSWKTS